MVIELEARFHLVVMVELEEGITLGSFRVVSLGDMPD